MKWFALLGLLLFLGVAYAPSINSGAVHQSGPPNKPDIITIRTRTGLQQDPPSHYQVFGLYCIVKNIGAPISDWGVKVIVIAEWYNFSNNSFEVYDTFFGAIGSSGDLGLGDTITVWFAYDDKEWGYDTHPYGIIRFRCNSSIYWPIGQLEVNLKNNNRTQIYFHPIYQIWIPLWISYEKNILAILKCIFWQSIY
jgi:hypothetical protein